MLWILSATGQAVIVLASFVPSVLAQQARPVVLANDKLAFTVSPTGGRFNKIVMKDGDSISPIAAIGHFLALDGFGAPSAEEQALGMPFHGEANRRSFEVIATNGSTPPRLVSPQSSH